MKQLMIGVLPVTNKICIGTVKNDIWQNDRIDVTDAAIYAVFQHLKEKGGHIEFGGKFKLSVEEIK